MPIYMCEYCETEKCPHPIHDEETMIGCSAYTSKKWSSLWEEEQKFAVILKSIAIAKEREKQRKGGEKEE